jgi:Sulfotransferase domain
MNRPPTPFTKPTAPQVPLRIAIVSTPRSGNTWARNLLTALYDLPSFAVHHPQGIDWANLPQGLVLQLHWPPTAELLGLFRQYQFQIVTLARHPLDVLLSILHYSMHSGTTTFWLQGQHGNEDKIFGAMPCSVAFLEYATGPRAAALLSVSEAWWSRPDCRQLRYETLVEDPGGSLVELAQHLGGAPRRPVDEVVAANTLESLRAATQAEYHFWQGQPGNWKRLLPEREAERIARSHEACFSRLQYICDADPALTVQEADENWVRLARQDLAQSLRDQKALTKTVNAVQAEVAQLRAALAAERERLQELSALWNVARAQIANLEPIAPGVLKAARAWQCFSRRFPRLSAVLKKTIGYDNPKDFGKSSPWR